MYKMEIELATLILPHTGNCLGATTVKLQPIKILLKVIFRGSHQI
jgi:hypothetical protein